MATTPLGLQDVRGTVDFAIVTVREDEFEAVLERLIGRVPVRGGKQQYEVCQILDNNGQERTIVAVRQLEQGHGAAQAVVSDVIADLDPRWLVLAGIAGGIADSGFSLGDVLLASRVHDFSVSATVESGDTTYQQRGGPVHPDVGRLLAGLSAWRERLGPWNSPDAIGRPRPRLKVTPNSLYGATKYRMRLRRLLLQHFPPNKRPRPPLFRVGPVGTSNTLVKRTLMVEQWQESARHLTHIEMEAGGAYEAAIRAQRPLLCVRGISDIVGLKRSDEWTAYACHSAASLVMALIKSGAIEGANRVPRDAANSEATPSPEGLGRGEGEGTSRAINKDRGRDEPVRQKHTMREKTASRPFWASDAIQMIDIGREFEKVVHHTKLIDRFLEGEKFFLCAAKGMGKTLLLAFKRYLLENGTNKAGLPSTPTGVRFVPSGKPYLDVMGDVPTMARESQEAYSTIEHAKRIWGLALRLSALSHVGSAELRLDGLPTDLATFVRAGRGIAPTEVFQALATLTISKLNQIYDGSQYAIERQFRDIQSGIVMFVDRVDQALMSLEKGAWIGLQCGLIEAAWDVMSANSHVKCFATIRQEAYSNYRSPTKNNLAGAVTEVAYEQEELYRLLDRLTSWYEAHGSFGEFTGLGRINNVRGDCEENAYGYLYRHTIGRPRDLVQMAEQLSVAENLSEDQYRRIVSRESSPIVEQVFEELGVFLDCLRNEPERRRLFRLIPYNVLTREELVLIYKQFNGVEAWSEFANEDMRHPFFELYIAGLLGVLKDGVLGGIVQAFKLPSDPIPGEVGDLIESDFYLLHPGVENIIKEVRGDYEVFCFAPVGQGCPWTMRTTAIVNAQRELNLVLRRGDAEGRQERRRHLRPKVLDVLRIVHARGQPGDEDRTPMLKQRASAPWRELNEILSGAGEYRELQFWIDRAVKGGTP